MSLFDIVGAGLSFFGQREQAKAARQAAQTQADAARQAAAAATDAATPYTVASLGGIAEFDPDKQAALLTLSPELTDIYQGGLSRSGLFGTQAAQYAFMDPFAAGEQFYQQMQPFFEEEGSTGGAEQQRALEEAIQKSRAQRRTTGFTQAQSLIDTLLGRERGDIAKSVGLLDIPLQQANVGRGVGGTVGSVAAAGLQSQAASQRLLAQTQALDPGLFGTLASGLGSTIRTNSLINQLKR